MEKYIKASFKGFDEDNCVVESEERNVDKAEYAMCLLALIDRFIKSEEELNLLFEQANDLLKEKGA